MPATATEPFAAPAGRVHRYCKLIDHDAFLGPDLTKVGTAAAWHDQGFAASWLPATKKTGEALAAVAAVSALAALGSAAAAVRAKVAALHLPPSIRVDYGGLYAQQAQSFRELALVFIAALLLSGAYPDIAKTSGGLRWVEPICLVKAPH